MNIFKKIILIKKIESKIKESKKLINKNKGLAGKVKKIFENIKSDFDELVILLPMLKDVKNEILETLKGLF